MTRNGWLNLGTIKAILICREKHFGHVMNTNKILLEGQLLSFLKMASSVCIFLHFSLHHITKTVKTISFHLWPATRLDLLLAESDLATVFKTCGLVCNELNLNALHWNECDGSLTVALPTNKALCESTGIHRLKEHSVFFISWNSPSAFSIHIIPYGKEFHRLRKCYLKKFYFFTYFEPVFFLFMLLAFLQ